MKPIRLLLLIGILNIALIIAVFEIITPPEAISLQLQQVSVQQPVPSEILKSGKPQQLVIAQAEIDIEVVDGLYDPETYEWTLSKDKAHYALMTPLANNQAGNTFIYGHNNKQVFTRLDKLTVGDEAVILTDNGRFTYRLTQINEVNPDDVSLFEYRGPSILTIQTCSGSWYEKRKLFRFDFVTYEAPL